MKKIKKVDSKAAQSIFSFACPCIASCGSCQWCGCRGGVEDLSETAMLGGKAAISMQALYGTQFANYS